MKTTVIDIARWFLFVREAGQNKGNRVEAIQQWGGGDAGQSWCCWFVTMVLDIFFQGNAPIPRLGRVQDVYDLAKKNNWLVDKPQPGDIFMYIDDNDHAHHIGFITVVTETATGLDTDGIAGNTSADGTSSNGDRVAEHGISTNPKRVKYVRYPTVT
jgi:hypothetical protein